MRHWGWRALMRGLFISVLVVGCAENQPASPETPPTSLPLITLTVEDITSRDETAAPELPTSATFPPLDASEIASATSSQPIATSVKSPTPFSTMISTPTPLPLEFPEPTCYETSNAGIVCLGKIKNTSVLNVERVVVRVESIRRDGSALSAQDVALEQRLIYAGETAPYRVTFPPELGHNIADEFGAVKTTLLRAEAATNSWAEVDDMIEVSDLAGSVIDGRYALTASLHNRGEADVPSVTLVATIYDSLDRVMGFRVLNAGQIDAGDSLMMRIELVAQSLDEPLRPALHVETQR